MEEKHIMRKNIAILSILATSLMSYAAMAQDEAAAPPEGAPPVIGDAPPAGAPPEIAPAPAPEAAAAPVAAPAGYPDEYALRPLTLAAGMFQATLPIVINLSKNAVAKPVWIPLDLRFGVTNEFEVFVSHNVTGALPLAAGGGLCIGGTDRGCDKFYNNVNVGGQFSFFKASGLELSGLLALDFRQISDPMLLSVDLGIGFKYVAAPVSVKIAPQIGILVTNRSGTTSTSGGTTTTFTPNKELIAVPLQVAFQAAPQIAIFLDSGLFSWTKNFGDKYIVPVGIGGDFLAMHGLDVGLEFMMPTLAKGSAYSGGAADNRTLMVFASWRSQ
jgi:hypothetical protein